MKLYEFRGLLCLFSLAYRKHCVNFQFKLWICIVTRLWFEFIQYNLTTNVHNYKIMWFGQKSRLHLIDNENTVLILISHFSVSVKHILGLLKLKDRSSLLLMVVFSISISNDNTFVGKRTDEQIWKEVAAGFQDKESVSVVEFYKVMAERKVH